MNPWKIALYAATGALLAFRLLPAAYALYSGIPCGGDGGNVFCIR